MSEAEDMVIVRETVTDERTLMCPVCFTAIDVPPIPRAPEALAEVFGVGAETLTRMFVDGEIGKAAQTMREHLARHTPEEWLEWGSDR